MTNPMERGGLERGPHTQEKPPIVTCHHCGGKKTIFEQGKNVPCKTCQGTGMVRDYGR